jgi:hypothetical protein
MYEYIAYLLSNINPGIGYNIPLQIAKNPRHRMLPLPPNEPVRDISTAKPEFRHAIRPF